MATQASSYSAQNVNVNWLGHSFSGFAEGDDVVNVERTERTMAKTIGMQGDGVFTQSADRSGMITVRLLQNSETNLFLSKKVQATEAGVIASGPMVITEAGSDAKAICNRTVIEGMPSLVRGAGHNQVEWTFLAIDILPQHGSGAEVA